MPDPTEDHLAHTAVCMDTKVVYYVECFTCDWRSEETYDTRERAAEVALAHEQEVHDA